MPHALSLDLRCRIVHACQAGELTQPEIADVFEVHLNTVEKLWRRWRTTGSMAAKPHAGGVKAHLAGLQSELRQLMAECSDHRLEDLVALIGKRYRVATSVPVLSRTLKALGLPRKKRHCGQRNGIGPPSNNNANGTVPMSPRFP
jgi:transposase